MSSIKVAIVDDHSLTRKSIRTILKEMGFDVVMEAANADELLQQLQGSNLMPQVCLLDYNMPGMMGYELAALLSKEYPNIKLAAYSSHKSISCLVEMLGNGCCAYFIKNGNPFELETGIKEIMQNGHHFSDWMKEELLSYIQLNYSIK